MKLGCSSSAYDATIRSGEIDLTRFVRICADDLDVDGVEFLDSHFPATDAHYLRHLKRTCTEAGLSIASIAVTDNLVDATRRQAESAHVRQWSDVAGVLGAPVVRVHAGRIQGRGEAGDEGRIIGMFRKVFGERGPDRRRIWSDVAWALRDCADHAAERGVMLALENDDAPGAVTENAHLLWQLTRDVGSPWLRSCPDAGKLYDHTALDLPVGQAVLARATFRVVAGDGSDAATYWPEVLRLLQLSRYHGYVMIDYGGDEAPTSAVPRAARYLRGALHLLARQQLLQETVAAVANEEAGRDDGYAVIEEAATVVARALRP